MGVLVLHTIGVALETVLGIKIFAKMFPMRKYLGGRQILSELILIGLLMYTVGFNFLKSMNLQNKRILFLLVLTFFGIYRYYIEKQNRLSAKTINIVNNLIFSIQLVSTIGLLTWNGWMSYISTGQILAGNLFVPFFLYCYCECCFVQAYTYKVLYLTMIGLMKYAYMVLVGVDRKLEIGSVNLSGIMHTYPVVLYGIAICVLIYLCARYLIMKDLLRKAMNQNKLFLMLEAMAAFWSFSLLTDLGVDGFDVQDLSIVLLFTIGIIAVLLCALAKMFVNALEGEKRILDIRNAAMEQQYQELMEAYQQNRCLIHDEKHMIQYIAECLENNEIQRAADFIKKYSFNISKELKHAWTGVPTLDFIINIKKRKMDKLSIEFTLSTQLDHIPIEDIDFVVLMGNLFDNAIEAVQQCEIKKIDLSIKSVNEMFLIYMQNTNSQIPQRNKGRFITAKKEKNNHGLGLESVRRIIEKYNGNIEFQYDRTMFQVKIMVDDVK